MIIRRYYSKKKITLSFVLIALIVGLFIVFIPRVFSSTPQNVFFLNQSFNNIAKNDIIPYLQLMERKWISEQLQVEALNKNFLIDKKALSIQWNLSQIKKGLLHRKNQNVPLYFSWDEKKVEEAFQFIAEKTNLMPQDAIQKDGRIIRSKTGYRLHPANAIDEIRNGLSQGLDKIVIKSYEVLPPAIDTKTLLQSLGFQHLLARYETSLAEKDENTRFNIDKSAKSIDGYILEKGEIFSFNKIVGPADKDDGYLETKVVVNGKLVPGYGGGVCQVSSTLYNALLQCDAKIIERSSHSGYSETTSYVEPGLDAAVSFGYKDLKFSFPQQRIAIFTYVDSDRLVAEIWGENEFSGTKSIMSQIQSITAHGYSEAFIEVETTVLKNDRIEKRYTDRYMIPKEYVEILKEQIDKNQ
ncbi:MAG TPA: hypothetical protein DF698_01690 [Candidatus Atribacteria bacterium]|nr:hypothetical protein [Candidatus Atribacteria bacterium]